MQLEESFMADIGLLKQGWKWLQSRKQAWVCAQIAASRERDKLVFLIDRHWPMVHRGFVSVGRLLLMLMIEWRNCAVRGFWSLISSGSAALLVVLWSCFLCWTSLSCLIYALFSLGVAGASICYLGYITGLFIVGVLGILIMWMFGGFWMAGVVLLGGGYMFSFNHARFLILMSAAYAVYCISARVGWFGVFLMLNTSFFSNDLLNKLLQGYDGTAKGSRSEYKKARFQYEKASEPVTEESSSSCEYSPPTSESENVAAFKSSCTMPMSNIFDTTEDVSPGKVGKDDSTALDEMKRIMDASNHYEILGFLQKSSSIQQY
uniref:Uncharacterized protein n=1 Tax=Ananas comosus var. bracteatus TaxID=296719 RepID=A0A6V7NLX6_ANACO|nr:unnamed protein product [Ananas comosus var. bracteatus]